ncbi:hypothetical protein DEO72_LG6g1210 [Vigna unguiculata]|uniref:Uncharacterized protein n=1 Tax=Vigna unguiculata TaxID=3917 RepID=A0A4D6M8Q3_VIGUN|nr:hypothetical protein DEO72_LG6g1210 [Vigna unguiculata]
MPATMSERATPIQNQIYTATATNHLPSCPSSPQCHHHVENCTTIMHLFQPPRTKTTTIEASLRAPATSEPGTHEPGTFT